MLPTGRSVLQPPPGLSGQKADRANKERSHREGSVLERPNADLGCNLDFLRNLVTWCIARCLLIYVVGHRIIGKCFTRLELAFGRHEGPEELRRQSELSSRRTAGHSGKKDVDRTEDTSDATVETCV